MSTITASNNIATKFMTHVASVLIVFVGLALALATILPTAHWSAVAMYWILPIPLGVSVALALYISAISLTPRDALKMSAYCAVFIVVAAVVGMHVPTKFSF